MISRATREQTIYTMMGLYFEPDFSVHFLYIFCPNLFIFFLYLTPFFFKLELKNKWMDIEEHIHA